MQIALNAHLLSFGPSYRGAGISRYIRQLLVNLRQSDARHSFTVFFGDRRLPPDLAGHARFHPRFSRLPTANPIVRLFWEQFLQPVELLRRRVDLLHSLGYVQPVACASRSVVTVHDLSFIRFPQSFNRQNRLYLRVLTMLSTRRTNRVIAVSESTKCDLVELAGVAADKIAVVYNGVEEHFRPIERPLIDQFRRSQGLPGGYVLYCGTLEPRKNLATLITAYAKLRRQIQNPPKLVLAGAKGWQCEGIFAAVERQGLVDDVIFPGYLPSAIQPLWYNGADVFVYPSLYEGFGFPPLEAMACGVPVIASRSSSLPEVVGNAGLLVDPRNAEALAESMRLVLTDLTLRRTLAETGPARAGEFTWARAARETLEVYRQA